MTMLEDVRGVKDEREIFLLFEDTDEDEDAIIDEEAWAIILMRAWVVFESLCDVKKTKKGDQEGLEFYLKDDIGKIQKIGFWRRESSVKEWVVKN